jgi:hypothetical protein
MAKRRIAYNHRFVERDHLFKDKLQARGCVSSRRGDRLCAPAN